MTVLLRIPLRPSWHRREIAIIEGFAMEPGAVQQNFRRHTPSRETGWLEVDVPA